MTRTMDRMDCRVISGARDLTKGVLAIAGEENSSAGPVVDVLDCRNASSSLGDELRRAGGK